MCFVCLRMLVFQKTRLHFHWQDVYSLDSVYIIYRYNMIHVSYICLPPQNLQVFGQKDHQLGSLKKPQVFGRLTDLKGLDDHGSWYQSRQIATFWWMLGTPEFCWFWFLMGWLFFCFFVGVWPWFGLFGQENVVVKHPTCMVMDEHGILVELEDPWWNRWRSY